jgi:hypothetical protein
MAWGSDFAFDMYEGVVHAMEQKVTNDTTPSREWVGEAMADAMIAVQGCSALLIALASLCTSIHHQNSTHCHKLDLSSSLPIDLPRLTGPQVLE